MSQKQKVGFSLWKADAFNTQGANSEDNNGGEIAPKFPGNPQKQLIRFDQPGEPAVALGKLQSEE